MRKRGDYLLYDCFLRRTIQIPNGSVKTIAAELGIDYTALSKLGKSGCKSIKDRFVLESERHKIFTLVELDSGKEYECLNNRSLFYQLGADYNENDGKYIYELKVGRQSLASIAGKVFMLKGGKAAKVRPLKNKSEKVNQRLRDAKARQKIKNQLYTRMFHALCNAKTNKAASYSELAGCTNEEFYNYIEAKFSKGMTWGNRNLWHLDHIKPCSSYDLTNKVEQRRCFHYTNIQPIWKNTETAMMFGESEKYVGNHNKSDSGEIYDYHIVDILLKNGNEKVFMLDREKAINLAKGLFEIGFRKVSKGDSKKEYIKVI